MHNVNAVTHLVGNKRALGLRTAAAFVPRLCCPLLLETVFLLTSLMLFTVSLKKNKSPWVEGEIGIPKVSSFYLIIILP